MADIKRTLADLLTNLFQDGQVAGAINAQDMRDLIESYAPPFGGANMNGNAVVTTINSIGVFEPIAGTFVANDELKEIGVTVSGGILKYTGVPARHFHVVSNFSILSTSNNQIICAQWHKNGTTVLPAPMEDKIGTGSDIRGLSVHTDVMMTTNDTLQLKIANSTSTGNLTVQDIYLYVIGMIHM